MENVLNPNMQVKAILNVNKTQHPLQQQKQEVIPSPLAPPAGVQVHHMAGIL